MQSLTGWVVLIGHHDNRAGSRGIADAAHRGTRGEAPADDEKLARLHGRAPSSRDEQPLGDKD
jgi:hypothetical protein